MENKEKRTLPVFVKYGLIAVAAIIAIAVGLVIYFNTATGYVAIVDGEKITSGEFKYQLENQKYIMYLEALSVDPNISEETFWATKIGGEDAIEVAKKKALDSLKDIKVQYKRAKEAKISLTAEEKNSLDQYIQTDIIDQMGGGNRIKANNAFKEQYGFSIDVLKNAQIQSYIVQKYLSREVTGIPDADANVDTYYEKNPDWYKSDSQLRVNAEEAVWARHILVAADEEATQEQKDTAKKKAEDIITRLNAGEDFASLAKELSEDPGSKERGGDYVFGKTASFYQEFKDAAFGLQPGQYTKTPVLTGAGYHIIKLDEKYAEGEPVSLKCAKEYYEFGTTFVKMMLYDQKVDEWVKAAKYEFNSAAYASIK